MPTDHAGRNASLSPIPFRDFSAEVQKLYQTPQKRPATLRKVRQVLREVSRYCAATSDLDPLAVARWLGDHPDRAAATRKSLLATLRSICSYGDFQDYLRNPFGWRKLASWIPADELVEEDPFARHRTAEEIGRVLAQADLEAEGGDWQKCRLRAAVYTWAFTGAGLKEVLGLRWQDLDLVERIIRVRSHPRRRLKTGARAARLPVAEPLAQVLAGWREPCGCEWICPGSRREGPWIQGAPGYRPTDRVKQLGDRAGVHGLTVLAFRHTFGTLSEDWGIGELMLQRILRHSKPKTQLYYRHYDAELLNRAGAKVHFAIPTPSPGTT